MKLAVKNLIVYSFISNFIKKLELFDQLFDHGVFGETMLCLFTLLRKSQNYSSRTVFQESHIMMFH